MSNYKALSSNTNTFVYVLVGKCSSKKKYVCNCNSCIKSFHESDFHFLKKKQPKRVSHFYYGVDPIQIPINELYKTPDNYDNKEHNSTNDDNKTIYGKSHRFRSPI